MLNLFSSNIFIVIFSLILVQWNSSSGAATRGKSVCGDQLKTTSAAPEDVKTSLENLVDSARDLVSKGERDEGISQQLREVANHLVNSAGDMDRLAERQDEYDLVLEAFNLASRLEPPGAKKTVGANGSRIKVEVAHQEVVPIGEKPKDGTLADPIILKAVLSHLGVSTFTPARKGQRIKTTYMAAYTFTFRRGWAKRVLKGIGQSSEGDSSASNSMPRRLYFQTTIVPGKGKTEFIDQGVNNELRERRFEELLNHTPPLEANQIQIFLIIEDVPNPRALVDDLMAEKGDPVLALLTALLWLERSPLRNKEEIDSLLTDLNPIDYGGKMFWAIMQFLNSKSYWTNPAYHPPVILPGAKDPAKNPPPSKKEKKSHERPRMLKA